MRNPASRTRSSVRPAGSRRRAAPGSGEHGAPHSRARVQGWRQLAKPLVLVGMMGAGKSTIGRRLAASLSLPFVDADEEIVAAAQMAIPEIFDAFGEPYFRSGERRVIARLLEEGVRVIATGGGAFAQPDTRALILERGIAIWLDSDLDTLVERVSRKNTRPLLRSGDPRAILEQLLAERRPAYEQAPIRVVSHSGPPTQTVASIIEALDTWR